VNQPVLFGFKEVRWDFSHGLRDVELLLEIYPCARVLLSYREEVSEQLNSGFWTRMRRPGVPAAEEDARLLAELRGNNAAIEQLHSMYPQATRLVPLTALKDVAAMDGLLAWLGYPGCRMRDTLHLNGNGSLTTKREWQRVTRSRSVQCDDE
jgi:hypothetical protein